MASTKPPEKHWTERYPAPSTKTPDQVTRDEVLAWTMDGNQAGKEYLIVDVRGDDHTGGFLHDSLNLPIESLYPTLPTLYNVAKSADIKTVAFYCVTSRGRGNRAAAWFGDYLREKQDDSVKSVAITDGILGFALAGNEYTQHIEEFDPEAWKKDDASKHVGQLK